MKSEWINIISSKEVLYEKYKECKKHIRIFLSIFKSISQVYSVVSIFNDLRRKGDRNEIIRRNC